MAIESLAAHLDPWLRSNTRFEPHPKDQERFHRALALAIENHESTLSKEQFVEAVTHWLSERNKFIDHEKINEYGSKAETIASFLFDTSPP